MITANELRIGNFIQANGPIMEVKAITKYDVELYLPGCEADNWNEDLEDCTGVPLTPAILEKCGFKRTDNSNEYWSFYILKNGWHVALSHHNEPSAGVKEGKVYYGDEYIKIESLHQLQNLYHALTGEEIQVSI